VIHLKQAARGAVFVVALVGVAAVAAAMWNQYTPTRVCLYCGTPEHYETALNATPRATTGAPSSRRSDLGLPPKPQALPEDQSDPPSHSQTIGSALADAPRGWEPWDDSKSLESPEFNPAATGPLWFGRGELRRMMAGGGHFGEPAGGIATAAPRRSHDEESQPHLTSSATVPNPAPSPGNDGSSDNAGSNPRNPGSNPAPPNQGSPTTTATPSTAPSTTPTATAPVAPGASSGTPSTASPTNPFVEHVTPPADPFVAPRPVGTLDPAGPGGTVTAPGGGPAANPEPASVFLIGTGLLALLTDLRRRRVI